MIISFKLILVAFFFVSNIFCNNPNLSNFNSKSYVTEDGIIRININVLGNVTNPGTYFAYEGINIMSIIAMAGGYKEGSNLSYINIYSDNGSLRVINLHKFLKNKDYQNNHIILKPNDTIIIKEKVLSKIFNSSNLPSIFLSILNIMLTINRTS